MSASDRLGARLAAIARNDDGAALAGLLPQIVAVVEVAEAQGLFDVFDDSTAYPLQKQLAAALTALDAALTVDGKE